MQPVHIGEFNRAIDSLSDKVEEGNETAKNILAEAKKTNGRVTTLEILGAGLALRMAAIENNPPLTKRDLWVAMGTLGGAAGLVKWLPALLKLGQG